MDFAFTQEQEELRREARAFLEANQRLTKLAMEILEGEDDGYWRHQQLRSRGNTIEAGTSEILRNIVAERVLGLPRSR